MPRRKEPRIPDAILDQLLEQVPTDMNRKGIHKLL